MIFTQRCQETLHADCIVRVIHDHTALFRGVYNLHTAIDLQMLESMLQLFCRYAYPKGNGRSCQRIVYIEFARNANAYRDLVLTLDVKFHTYKIQLGDIVDILCLEACARLQAKAGPRTRNIFYDFLNMLVIYIDQGTVALVKQLFLIIQIFRKIRMLIFSDMIRGNICKQTIVKMDSGHTVHFHGLGGNLHHAALTALFHHFCEIAVQIVRLRCGIHRRKMLFPDINTVGSDHAGLFAGCL